MAELSDEIRILIRSILFFIIEDNFGVLIC
jgi:hypothetical protein